MAASFSALIDCELRTSWQEVVPLRCPGQAVVQAVAEDADGVAGLVYRGQDKLPDIAIGGLQMRDLLVAIVFLVGTISLIGGELFYDNLFGVPSAAILVGALLCVLAAIAKDRIDRDMTLF
jgi:hypothetical protein